MGVAVYAWGVVAPIGAVLALVFAYVFYRWVRRQAEGDERMREIAGYVRTGAMAYLRRQYKVVAVFFLVMFLVFSFLASQGAQSWLVPFAFFTGGFFSGLAGFVGMRTATLASNRVTAAAREGLNGALQIAFRAGAVMGLTVVGLGLLDICLWFVGLRFIAPLFGYEFSLHEITVTMLCFGMGASSQALFARVGGGIFTKAADVGADLVGKVEAGIPEDDPRNPATIADNVGDNVGDVAGMGADLYESYCGSILATAALGVSAGLGPVGIILPLVMAGVGIIFSIAGVYWVRTKEGAGQKELMAALNRGVFGSSGIVLVVSLAAAYFFLHTLAGLSVAVSLGVGGSIVVGLLAGIVIGKSTEYYTSSDYGPTRGVAGQSVTGPATVIIDGLAVGMKSTAIPAATIGIGILLAYGLAGGFTNAAMGLFGISIAAVGMLSTLGITLATDAYGPIADNAGGNAEMSHQAPEVRRRTDSLDSLGNTTAAAGKGFAIGSAALTAMALIAAYIEEIRIWLIRNSLAVAPDKVPYLDIVGPNGEILYTVPIAKAGMSDFMQYFNVTLMNPKLLAGLFAGASLAFLFSALAMQAVGRAARKMVEEVRRQFREIAGIMEGQATPDYATCVSISTAAAQKEMIAPSLMAIAAPVVIGVLLGPAAVVGLLAGGLSTGFVLAVMMNNAGGAWDNAKKYIESGQHGGKGSPSHKAGVVGDTVGDPFKDTSGPCLNILIKLMSMVSIVFAGATVKMYPVVATWFRGLFEIFH
ncbi:MAG: sodium-translocating pyrophosphatase [Planctomycetota bacterium]